MNDVLHPEIAQNDFVGFYQWLNVFQGRIIRAEEALENLNDGDYDVIHVQLRRKNVALIRRLKEKFGPNSKTKLVVSLDIPVQYWKKEFGSTGYWKAAILKADFILGTTYEIKQALEKITGRNIYEIPHPADLEKIRAFQSIEKGGIITILWGRPVNVIRNIARLRSTFGPSVKIRILSYRYKNLVEQRFIPWKNIEVMLCRNEAELCRGLAESRFILVPEENLWYGNEYHNYESIVVYAAAMGAIVLGNKSWETVCRCYPEVISANIKNCISVYQWLTNDAPRTNNLIETAKIKVEYYDWGNLQKRFLDWLYDETQDERFYYRNMKSEHPSLFKQIRHIHGNLTVAYDREEFAVVCLVKNGAEYIHTFVDHYQRLGAKYFFFIDNGSTDETVALLKQYRNITVYETKLPHKKYECEIRRAIIEEHCRNGWCLCVDIDELFEYPYSNRISMRDFLRYLNSQHYTAVLSYLLDMFSAEVEFAPPEPGEDMVKQYCYYDISNIEKHLYGISFAAYTNYNNLSDKNMTNYSGGIRRKAFVNHGGGYLLSKHPLFFIDGRIEPVVHPHYSNKAFIADINGVLKHYKFISSFKEKVVRSLEFKDYCYYAELEYKEYLNVIKDKNRFSLYSPQARKLENIEQLVREGFLRVSEKYRAYVGMINPQKL